MFRATLKSLLSRKLRLLLSATAIVLGVSFVSGAFVLTDSLGRVFDDLFSTVNKNVAVDVRGKEVLAANQGGPATRMLVPQDVLAKVRSVDGVADAQPGITGTAELVGKDRKVVTTGGAPTFGFNWTESPTLQVAKLSSGHAPRGPHEIVINRSLAEDAGYSVGATAPVLTDAGEKRYRIVGIAVYENNEGSLGGSTNIFFDLPTAQRVLDRKGTFDEITVAADDGVSEGDLRSRISGVLPSGTEAITGTTYTDEQSSDVKDALGFFSTFLLVFALIALFVGAFIIFNTFSMLVAQRTRELAMLRALGASRGQVIRSVLLEAVLVGLVSSAAGLLLGIGVAAGLRAAFGAVGAEFPSGPTIVALRTVIASFVVGVVITAIAALMPAVRASRVAPVAAMRDAAAPDRPMRRQLIGGGIVLVVGIGLMGWALAAGILWMLGVGTLACFVGVALVSPMVSQPVTSVLGRVFARRLPGQLGRQNSMRNPRRTASTAAALMIGIALVSAVSVLGASLKASVEKIVDNAIGSQFVLSTQGPGFANDALRAASRVDGVSRVTGVRVDSAAVDGSPQFVTAFPTAAIGSAVKVAAVDGDPTKLSADGVLISDKAANKLGVGVGDSVKIALGRNAAREYQVAATYEPNQLLGDYVLEASQARLFSNVRNVAALVDLSPGASAGDTRKALDQALARFPNIEVQDRSEFVKAAADQVDQIVAIISILLLLSVIIAVLGVVNTLALSIIERTREIGLLRAVGMARRQVKRMIRVEAVVISVFGGLLGLLVGAAFGVALQRGLEGQGVTELAFPIPRLVLFLIIAGLAGVLAAWLPARRASRLNVLQAIYNE